MLNTLIILFNFCKKLVWFDGINLFVILNIFLLTKQVLFKTIVILLDKLTRYRVLQGKAGLRGASKGGNGVKKISLSCRAERGWDKTK